MPKTVIHTLKYFLGIDEPHSQTSLRERNMIKKYAYGKSVALEIGVYEGFTSELIANSLAKDGKLYSIDPFIKGRLGICYSELIAKAYWKKKKCNNNIKLFKDYSYNVSAYLNTEFDFIFIDGDHSYEGIKKDWEDWTPKLKIGGFILLHDTRVPDYNDNIKNLGSFKFYNEQIVKDKNFNTLEYVDSLTVLEKSN